MAGLLFVEGFETFGPTGTGGTNLQEYMREKWTKMYTHPSASVAGPSGAYEDEGLYFNFYGSTNSQYELVQSFPPTTNELIVGFAWYTRSTSKVITIYSGSNQISLDESGGFFRVYTGGVSYVTPKTMSSYTWYYVELKYKIHDTTGYWELWIDGVLVDSETNIDTKSSSYPAEITSHTWKSYDLSWGTGHTIRLDDIYIYDNTGDVQEPYGPIKVRALFPDGDDTTDWTSTGANHYDQVNNNPVDTANYVESDTANDVDLFTFANSTDPVTWPVLGVQLNIHAAVTDVGYLTLEGIADSNGTQDTANVTIGDDMGGIYCMVFEDDPETSNTWTMSKLNTAKFGVGVE